MLSVCENYLFQFLQPNKVDAIRASSLQTRNGGPVWFSILLQASQQGSKAGMGSQVLVSPGVTQLRQDQLRVASAEMGWGGAFLAALAGSTTPPVLAASLPLAPSSWRPPWLVMVPGTDPPLPHLRLSPLSTLSLECHSCCAHTGNPCSSFQN